MISIILSLFILNAHAETAKAPMAAEVACLEAMHVTQRPDPAEHSDEVDPGFAPLFVLQNPKTGAAFTRVNAFARSEGNTYALLILHDDEAEDMQKKHASAGTYLFNADGICWMKYKVGKAHQYAAVKVGKDTVYLEYQVKAWPPSRGGGNFLAVYLGGIPTDEDLPDDEHFESVRASEDLDADTRKLIHQRIREMITGVGHSPLTIGGAAEGFYDTFTARSRATPGSVLKTYPLKADYIRVLNLCHQIDNESLQVDIERELERFGVDMVAPAPKAAPQAQTTK